LFNTQHFQYDVNVNVVLPIKPVLKQTVYDFSVSFIYLYVKYTMQLMA